MPLQATSGAASYDAFGGGVAAVPNYIEDVFSTWLYTGNGSTQTITNGIDLAGEGGLVWIKQRADTRGHVLVDTVRGPTKFLTTCNSAAVGNATDAEGTDAARVPSFTTSGFTLGADSATNSGSMVSWTFREQPKFFDVVTYTGNGSSPRTISHNLGSVPGCIIVKKYSTSGQDWFVHHRALSADFYGYLNATSAFENTFSSSIFNGTAPTSTVFTIGSTLNQSGETYVAYLFAHNAGGFGLSGTDNVISCGSYTGNSTSGVAITLGYEPQWLLIKRTDSTGNWTLIDTMRGFPVGSNDSAFWANTNNAELSGQAGNPTATGFYLDGSWSDVNAPGGSYIYIAIRRGPMKVPTTGTSVFHPFARAGNDTQTDITGVGFTPDLWMVKSRNIAADFPFFDRLRGVTRRVVSNSTNAEETFSGSNGLVSLNMNGITIGAGAVDGGICNDTGTNYGNWLLKRAPGFFDEVCYTGTGSAMTVAHNLGVAPELMIVKSRSTSDAWPVYSAATGNSQNLFLNQTDAAASRIYWNNTTPTASVFSLGNSSVVSNSGTTYVAYLFASCPGVQSIQSYVGDGTTGRTINCGFTGGARFVCIKATSTTGSWWTFDSARGIVTNNDPALQLNSAAAEVTSADAVDTAASGFIVNQEATCSLNASGVSYLVWAIA